MTISHVFLRRGVARNLL